MKAVSEFTDLIVFGSRGHSVAILLGMEILWRGKVRLRAVIDELENGAMHPQLNVPVISMEERLRDWADIPVLLTPADTKLRERIAARLAAEGATLATANAKGLPTVHPSVRYGPGSLCVPQVQLGPNVQIGANAQILSRFIAHDVEIGPCSNLNMDSSVLGHVQIGAHVNIAPYAVIANGSRERPLVIGDGAIIGVGSVVVSDVAPGARVGGNPAMEISRWKKLHRLIDQMPDDPTAPA